MQTNKVNFYYNVIVAIHVLALGLSWGIGTETHAQTQTVRDSVIRQKNLFKGIDEINSRANRKIKQAAAVYKEDMKKWVAEGSKGAPPKSLNQFDAIHREAAQEIQTIEKAYFDESKRMNEEEYQASLRKSPVAPPPEVFKGANQKPVSQVPSAPGQAIKQNQNQNQPVVQPRAPVQRVEVVVDPGDTPNEISFPGAAKPAASGRP